MISSFLTFIGTIKVVKLDNDKINILQFNTTTTYVLTNNKKKILTQLHIFIFKDKLAHPPVRQVDRVLIPTKKRKSTKERYKKKENIFFLKEYLF